MRGSSAVPGKEITVGELIELKRNWSSSWSVTVMILLNTLCYSVVWSQKTICECIDQRKSCLNMFTMVPFQAQETWILTLKIFPPLFLVLLLRMSIYSPQIHGGGFQSFLTMVLYIHHSYIYLSDSLWMGVTVDVHDIFTHHDKVIWYELSVDQR